MLLFLIQFIDESHDKILFGVSFRTFFFCGLRRILVLARKSTFNVFFLIHCSVVTNFVLNIFFFLLCFQNHVFRATATRDRKFESTFQLPSIVTISPGEESK